MVTLSTMMTFTLLSRKRQLLDNVISKMEKYATNLEEIVTDRTQQLADEKSKTEELLHKMLPK